MEIETLERILFVIIGVVIGMLFVLSVVEINTDIIHKGTLDKVCVKLHGDYYRYVETNPGDSHDFVCEKAPYNPSRITIEGE